MKAAVASREKVLAGQSCALLLENARGTPSEFRPAQVKGLNP